MYTKGEKIPQVILLSGGGVSSRLQAVSDWVKQLLPEIKNDSENLLECIHPDLLLLPSINEKGKAEKINIEDVRAAILHLQYSAHQGGSKIVVFFQADSMSVGACNALLKMLEEPISDSYVFLLSEYSHLLPVTLKSRCWKVVLPHEKKVSQKLLTHIETVLRSMQEEKMSVFQAAEKFQSIDFLEMLDAFYYFCMHRLCIPFLEEKWFQWIDLINQVREQLLKKQNPNCQIALANILYTWKTLS